MSGRNLLSIFLPGKIRGLTEFTGYVPLIADWQNLQVSISETCRMRHIFCLIDIVIMQSNELWEILQALIAVGMCTGRVGTELQKRGIQVSLHLAAIYDLPTV